jgi:hypothetical protein
MTERVKRIAEWLQTRERRRFARRVIKVLQRRPREAVPHDQCSLDGISIQLNVTWQARGVHPWDRDLPRERQANLCIPAGVLDDTLFMVRSGLRRTVEIDTLRICVLEPSESQESFLREQWRG